MQLKRSKIEVDALPFYSDSVIRAIVDGQQMTRQIHAVQVIRRIKNFTGSPQVEKSLKTTFETSGILAHLEIPFQEASKGFNLFRFEEVVSNQQLVKECSSAVLQQKMQLVLD